MKNLSTVNLWLPVVLIFALPLYVHAQPTHIKIGDRVKIYAPAYDNKFVVGRVEETSSFSLLVTSGDKQITIPYNEIQTIKVSIGQKSRWKLGFALGSVSGALVGSLFVKKPKCNSTGYSCVDFTGLENIGKVSTGIFFGALVGAGVGLAFKKDHWQGVSLGLAFDNTLKSSDFFSTGPSVIMRIPINR